MAYSAMMKLCNQLEKDIEASAAGDNSVNRPTPSFMFN